MVEPLLATIKTFSGYIRHSTLIKWGHAFNVDGAAIACVITALHVLCNDILSLTGNIGAHDLGPILSDHAIKPRARGFLRLRLLTPCLD